MVKTNHRPGYGRGKQEAYHDIHGNLKFFADDPAKINDADFDAAADIMSDHGTSDISTDYYYFWIGKGE